MSDTPPPPSEGDILGGVAAPFPVHHKGRAWLVGAPTVAARDALNKLVVDFAMQSARASDIELPGLAAFAEFRTDHAQRKYRPGGPKWREWVTGEFSNALFLASLLHQHQPREATVDLALELIREQPDAVAVALGEMVPPFFDLLAATPDLPPEWAMGFRETGRVLRAKVAAATSLPPVG